MSLYPLPLGHTLIYHPFFKGGRVQSRNLFWRGNIGVNTTYTPNHLEDPRDGYLHSRIAPGREFFFFLFIHFIMVTFINYLFNYLPWTFTYLFSLAFYSPLVHFSGGGECKDPSHFLFSGFVYCYLHNPFSSYTVNILNVSYYLTIERDLVQVGLMSKDPTSLQPLRYEIAKLTFFTVTIE